MRPPLYVLDLCLWSRAVNRFLLFGRWEMVCTRADREDWRWFVVPMDSLMLYARGEWFHCAWCRTCEG